MAESRGIGSESTWLRHCEKPTARSIAKVELKKEQRRSPRLRIKQKKSKLTVKMIHRVLARGRFPGKFQKLDGLMLREYPGRYKKSLSKPTVETIKKRTKAALKKKKERKRAVESSVEKGPARM
ncbi:hypothetical protein EJB05_22806, partial [Eragrostis curvula]